MIEIELTASNMAADEPHFLGVLIEYSTDAATTD